MNESRGQHRGLVASTSLGAGVVLVAMLVAMVNYLGWKYYHRFDWTSGEIYSLSEKSRSVVAELDRDIEVVVFMGPGSQLYPAVTELLSRYEAASGRISVQVIDPERRPGEAQQLIEKYQVSSLNTVVFESGEDRRIIEEADLAEYDYSGMQFGQGPQIQEFLGEQLFTGAILELVESRKPKILFTTGHGEAALDDYSAQGLSEAANFLGRDNFDIESWASLGAGAVPEGTDLVVVAGPEVPFLEPELELLTDFIVAGGRVLLLLDPTLAEGGLERSGFGSWLERFGVELGSDVVVDPENPLPFYSAETFFATDYADHPITEALEDASYPVVFSLARSVGRIDGEQDAGIEVSDLVRTSPAAWGETDLANLGEVEKGEEDVPGPVSLAVAVEVAPPSAAPDGDEAITLIEDGEEPSEPTAEAPRDDEGEAAAHGGEGEDTQRETGVAEAKPGRLVVFGDSDFAANAHLASVGNPTLLLNTMNWLVERENLLAIPPKKAEQVQLDLTRAELRNINLLVLVLMPLAAVVLGIGVYVRRRR